ncbi:probable LRR receptor-like serine/threonine-protein kinase At4g29180 [Nymphaea colorata]|nr:probable LRR receptor-like serine/threonine-protein kinase At4g29180 [Nymphaea colorata]
MMDAHNFSFLLCCAAALSIAGAQRARLPITLYLSHNLTYVSDDGFIDSGVNIQIESGGLTSGTNKGYYTVRSFPNYTRNCYQLPATIGDKYIIRASFLYGNYDGLNTLPSFDLYLGVNFWDTVNLTDNNTPFRPELVVQAEASYLFVCLVRTGNGTPFISYLKLWPLNADMYAPANSSLSLALKTFMRVDAGTTTETAYPDDRFDRIWSPDYDGYGTPFNTTETVSESGDPMFGMPSVVMQTAVYSKDVILVNWTGGVDDMFYLYLEFADVVRPANAQSRLMNVLMNGQQVFGASSKEAGSFSSMMAQSASAYLGFGFGILVDLLSAIGAPSGSSSCDDLSSSALLCWRGLTPVLHGSIHHVLNAFKFSDIDKPGEGGRPQDHNKIVASFSQHHASSESGKSGTFTYSQVVEITNNFEKVIGRGGSGTVFYGRLKDGHEVAVKKLSSRFVERGVMEFAAEVNMLMQVHYKYLAPFVGYCDDEQELILIYEYMSNGNLQNRLSEEMADTLNWQQRLNIALDAAKGLENLHSGCTPAFIHREVKSSNILINEKFEAKVADFGLSKAVVSDEITHITTVVAGTAGYLDPEYCYTNKVIEKSDVYGFGVVLFELITGRSAISTNAKGERLPLVQLVRPELMRGTIKAVIDPRLHGQYDISSMWMVAELAMTCTEEMSVIRSTMTEVVAHLKEAKEIERTREKSGSWRKWAIFTSSSSSATATSNSDLSIYPPAS